MQDRDTVFSLIPKINNRVVLISPSLQLSLVLSLSSSPARARPQRSLASTQLQCEPQRRPLIHVKRPRDVLIHVYRPTNARKETYEYMQRNLWALAARAYKANTVRRFLPVFASIRQHTSAYVSVRQNTPACISILQLARIRQHASAYARIRQHTSAYVSSPVFASIRQHTSAYASTRQHTSACQQRAIMLACIRSACNETLSY
jgi:hypothetical protein